MKRFLILFMILGFIAGSVATAEAEQTERTVEVSYYGAQLSFNLRSCAIAGGAGCVTIDTHPGEASMTAVVTDAHGLPVSVRVVDGSSPLGFDGTYKTYGTFCGHTTQPIRFDPGAKLEFWVGGEWWPTWWIIPELEGCSPSASTTGTIRVTLEGWTTSEGAHSPSPGGSPAPQPSPTTQPETVERSVDLVLRRHLRGEGMVTSDDLSCRANVPVVIQRKRSSDWIEVGSTTTDSDGAFAIKLTDRAGRYRAVTPEGSSSERTCLAATSPTVRHRH